MNINQYRNWITPLVIGSFLVTAVTGILMFFHLDINLNKLLHQWLSWVLVAGVLLHIILNLHAFKRYFTLSRVRWMMACFALLLLASFLVPKSTTEKPAYAASVQVLANSPLKLLAIVGQISTEDVYERLHTMGYTPKSEEQILSDVIGNDIRTQAKVLSKILTRP